MTPFTSDVEPVDVRALELCERRSSASAGALSSRGIRSEAPRLGASLNISCHHVRCLASDIAAPRASAGCRQLHQRIPPKDERIGGVRIKEDEEAKSPHKVHLISLNCCGVFTSNI